MSEAALGNPLMSSPPTTLDGQTDGFDEPYDAGGLINPCPEVGRAGCDSGLSGHARPLDGARSGQPAEAPEA